MFSLICVWINGWINNREAGDLRRYRAHSDVIVMKTRIRVVSDPLNAHRRCFLTLCMHANLFGRSRNMYLHFYTKSDSYFSTQKRHKGNGYSLSSVHFVSIVIQWRHNWRDGVSNHQPHDCLLNRLFRLRSKKTSKLRVTSLCAGNSLGPVNSPHKWPVTRKMLPFDNVIMARTTPILS